MSENIKIVKKRKFSFGTFFFGTFVGFVLCIGTLVGLGFFAYNKISANWVNDKFKTDINLGTEELNEKTIKQFVVSATNMLNNLNTYTLNDLNKDFGVTISDEIMGFNIKSLKEVPIGEISTELQKRFNNISADDLDGIIDISNMNKILNKYNTYYYNATEGKLYRDKEMTTTVAFAYTVNDNILTIAEQNYAIEDGKVGIKLKYLPITTAISDFTANMGDQITLGELEVDYGVELPEYFNGADRSVTINELSTEIDKLHLANFLGYTYDKTTDKYFNDKNRDGLIDSGEELTGVIGALADTTISGVSNKIENLVLSDLFSEEELSKGALSLINKDTKIDNIAVELENAFKEATLDEVINAGIVAKPANYDSIKNNYIVGSAIQVKDLKLSDLVSNYLATLNTTGSQN